MNAYRTDYFQTIIKTLPEDKQALVNFLISDIKGRNLQDIKHFIKKVKNYSCFNDLNGLEIKDADL
jgi:hypothetical protein